MTWETTIQGKLWTHGVATALCGKPQKKADQARGGRTVDVKRGVYVIDHKPTGRFIIGTSENVSKDVDKQLKALAGNKHSMKRLQSNYSSEPYLQITEIPARNEKELKQIIQEIRDTNTTEYCLLEEGKPDGVIPRRKSRTIAALD